MHGQIHVTLCSTYLLNNKNYDTCFLTCVSIDQVWTYNKSKPSDASDYWSRDMVSFNFLKKSLGLVSPPYFVHDFSRKIFLMLYFISWSNFIVWLSLLLEISGNMGIAIVCYPAEIHLSFLIKPFSYMTKHSEQKLNCLKNETSF